MCVIVQNMNNRTAIPTWLICVALAAAIALMAAATYKIQSEEVHYGNSRG